MKSLDYFATLLGTNKNGVRRIARDLKVERYKDGTVELFNEAGMMNGISKKAKALSKRTITKAHQKKMQDGKTKKKEE